MLRQTEEGEVKGMVVVNRTAKGGEYVGNWRARRPEVDYGRCTACLLCAMYCPEAAITSNAEGKPEIDLRFCKGCGICANECPVKAIKMVREA